MQQFLFGLQDSGSVNPETFVVARGTQNFCTTKRKQGTRMTPPSPSALQSRAVRAYDRARSEICTAGEHESSHLYLAEIGLTELPKEIGQCWQLQVLKLSNNYLTELPDEICNCTNLRELYLDGNLLRALPLGMKKMASHLEAIYLQHNDLEIPPEILGPTWEKCGTRAPAPAKTILDYYFSNLEASDPLDEVKMIVVGRGGAGKTSIVKRLVSDTFDASEKETPGIAQCDWLIEDCPNGGPVLAHIWDFAGQIITHSTHQFFFSARAAYILVLTGRENSERDDAEYWLRLIIAFGTDHEGKGPPVIVALNKWEDSGTSRPRIDRGALRERYPFIVDFIETDCSSGLGISKMRHTIANKVGDMEWVRTPFPRRWKGIKSDMSSMREPYLTYRDYQTLCVAQGITDDGEQKSLSETLHRLGIALNYSEDPRLRDTTVLNPHWLTENVYKLLRCAESTQGLLTFEQIKNAISTDNPERMQWYLVEVMERFELAYALEDAPSPASRWLVPQALPDSQPDGIDEFRIGTNATRLRYTYVVLPQGIVPRFTVRTHALIHNNRCWMSGVVLSYEGAFALVRVDSYSRQINLTITRGINVNPEFQRRLAGLCQNEFRSIHSEIKGLCPVEETLANGEWVKMRTLERDEAENRPTCVDGDNGTMSIDTTEALNSYSTISARDDSWKPKLFVSYSHSDERQRRCLDLHLKVLETEGLVALWHDRKIAPGDKWDDVIRSEIQNADVMLLLLSAAALASEYIRSVEIATSLERNTESSLVVIPIIVERCLWSTTPLGKLQALPRDGKPVRDFSPQRNGWHCVAEELRRMLIQICASRR